MKSTNMEYANPKDRPLYTKLAWAYDDIIRKPVARWAGFMESQLREREILPPERVLDAGCGTGEYVLALARHGYVITGIDISQDMTTVARAKVKDLAQPANILDGDFLTFRAPVAFSAVLCRGVLNDLLTDETREQAFASFHNNLRPDGLLLLDVRNWEKTAELRTQEPVNEKVVNRGTERLSFRSEIALDWERHLQLIDEIAILSHVAGEDRSACQFIMRCWTVEELTDILRRHNFEIIHLLGDYDSAVPVGSTDRIIAVARRF